MSFDARDPGTAATDWQQDPRRQLATPLTLDGVRRLLVIAAHPDDETLGAGGLIATATAAGIPVTVVVVTDGAAASPDDKAVRSAEVRAAVAALGADEPQLLAFADGAVREERAAIRRALHGIAAAHPRALVVAPWQGDGHRDHRVLGEIVAEVAGSWALDVWSYPIWLWHWASPGDYSVPWADLGSFSLSAPALAAKEAALACFPSQTLGPEPLLHPRFLEHFRAAEELFVRVPR